MILISAVPRKGLVSTYKDTMYMYYHFFSVHNQLIRTLFEAHRVYTCNICFILISWLCIIIFCYLEQYKNKLILWTPLHFFWPPKTFRHPPGSQVGNFSIFSTMFQVKSRFFRVVHWGDFLRYKDFRFWGRGYHPPPQPQG